MNEFKGLLVRSKILLARLISKDNTSAPIELDIKDIPDEIIEQLKRTNPIELKKD